MSGSGKTSVGEYVADKLDKTFLDTDDIIISNTGKDIEYIFNNYGEECFRKLEELVINTSAKKENMVISTGGGVVLNPTNIEKLKTKGIIFLLNGSIDTLYRNIIFSKSLGQRPLLKEGDLKKKIEGMYDIRKGLYLNSEDYLISIDDKGIEEIGDEIINIFREVTPCS